MLLCYNLQIFRQNHVYRFLPLEKGGWEGFEKAIYTYALENTNLPWPLLRKEGNQLNLAMT
jgi:hypothetical protein